MTTDGMNTCSRIEEPMTIAVIRVDGNRRKNLQATLTDKIDKRFAATGRTR